MSQDYVSIDVELKDETDKAYLVISIDTEKEAWVPKSWCHVTLGRDRVSAIISLPEWMAEEKELI